MIMAELQLAEMIRRNEAILREIEEAREAAALARADEEAVRNLLFTSYFSPSSSVVKFIAKS